MKTITRSRSTVSTDSAANIYHDAVHMLEKVEKRPVRLVGIGIYDLSKENERQLSFEDYLDDTSSEKLLSGLERRYKLDFSGHLTEIYQGETLHKTVEYMRKHFQL